MPSKELKISVQTDQNSANQTKRILTDLTTSLEKLVNMSNRLATTMAGLSGGRGIQGTGMGVVSSRAPLGVVGSATGPLANARGGLLGSLLGGDSGQNISAMGTATVSALGSVEQKVKSYVSSTIQELSKLQAAVSNVTGAMGGMAGGAGGEGAPPGKYWKSGEWWDIQKKGRRQSPEAEAVGIPESDEGGGGPGPSTGGGGGRSRGGGGKKRSDGTKPFRMNPLSQYGLMGGITAGFLPALGPLFSAANLGEAGLGLAARYGFGKGEQLNDWMVSERMARIGMTLNRPGETLSRKTEIASPFGMMTQAVLGKSYSTRIGYMSAIHDPAFLEALGNKTLLKEAADIRAYGEGTAKGTIALLANEGRNAMGNKGVVDSLLNSVHQNSGSFLGDAVGAIGAQVGAVTELVSRAASPNPNGPTAGTTKETKFDIALREELAKIDPHNADILRQAIQGKTEMQGPLFNHMVDEIYGNALGRTMAYRGLGLGGGTIKDKDGNYKTALEAHRAKLLARGWDIPNEESARQAILSIGTGFNQVYGQSSNALMGMGMSGLSNLPQLMKLGGMLTGSLSGSKGFIDNVLQASIGTGGLDVAPGRELVQSLAEMALKSGQFGIGNAAGDMIKHYAGLVHGYQGYEFDTAEQHRRSMNIQLGLAEFGQYTSGKAAPMYDVMRQVSAIQATGGKWSYMTDVLSNLPPALQKSITEDGTIPL